MLISPTMYISPPLPPTLYGHLMGFFVKIYEILEKSLKFPIKISHNMTI